MPIKCIKHLASTSYAIFLLTVIYMKTISFYRLCSKRFHSIHALNAVNKFVYHGRNTQYKISGRIPISL